MNDRTVWIVRILGIGIFLLMMFLMLNLYSNLREIRDDGSTVTADPQNRR
ncbi:MAG TPA: hypothetical protein VM557_03235 [Thermoanaerobaculia bacterium]|nr:hypothetical protein [Thermoanaerobaculia bacterium]